jgi:hypothetical protein
MLETTDNLENTDDTAPVAETATEQGTVVENTEDTTPVVETAPIIDADSKELSKVQMRKNQLENQAKELEEATGIPLEELIAKLRTSEDEQVTAQPETPTTDDVDMERFAELTEMAVKAKYGDKFARLDRMDEHFAKLEAKEAVSQLPADYKEYEKDMMDIISKNPNIMKTNEGVMTAYLAAKGKNLDKIVESAQKSATTKLNETEEVKKVAFVENAKSSGTEQKAASIRDIVNLSSEEYGKIPKEERMKILKSLSQ